MTHRILVTGATGFIGQALTTWLATMGWSANVAVRRSNGNLRNGNLQEFVVGDIDAQTDWTEALRGCVAVVHLAARVHVMKECAADPVAEFRKVNAAGTLNLARQAAKAGARRFVFLSTVKVNGEATCIKRPFSPEDVPAPEDAYAGSKLEAELALKEVCAESGMEFVVIRPPLVYGPGVQGNFRSMVRWVKRGIPLPLGAISNRRSLVALDNLVSFTVACLEHPAAANQVFLISDGEPVSTTELLRKIARSYGVTPRQIPMPQSWLHWMACLLGRSAAADRLLGSLVVDDVKARDLLGWRPAVTMDEQLRKMALYDARS